MSESLVAYFVKVVCFYCRVCVGGILVNLIIGDLIIGDTAMELGTPGKIPA